jgi:hypothetical protein
MLKSVHLIRRSIALIALVSTAVMSAASTGLTQEMTTPNEMGICGIGNISGRSIVARGGRLISLVDFCRQQSVPIAITDTEQAAFWQAFLEVASPRALQFVRSVDRQQVIDYAATVCPVLRQGSTLQQVREIQTQSNLPPTFDAAVNVAAIHTYCPEYTAQIGR